MPKELTRAETIAAFDYEIMLRMECIDILENTPKHQLQKEDEVQRCIIRDKMFAKMGIEQEDYNLAVNKHHLENDEYVLKRTDEVEKCVSEELRNQLIEPFF